MNCFKCGTNSQPDDKFCGECGTELDVKIGSAFNTQKGLNLEDIRLNLGMVYFKMGKYDKALIEFQKVLEHNPDDSKAQEMLELIENEHLELNK